MGVQALLSGAPARATPPSLSGIQPGGVRARVPRSGRSVARRLRLVAALGPISAPGSAELLPLDHSVPTEGYSSIPSALDALARGEMVVVVDDEDRENEGDLVLAADKATPEALAFMIRHTSGVVCVALEEERLNVLGLPQMVESKVSPALCTWRCTFSPQPRPAHLAPI